MASIGRDEAEPLLEALHDPSPETRLAVLDALTRLPLDPDTWLALRPYVSSALEDSAAPEHLGVIALAARVPVRSLRHQLGYLAREGNPDERALAAGALAEVGDVTALEPLLALLDPATPGWDAARLLARLDVSARIEDVRRHAAAHSDEAQFWLALALARAGDDSELHRVLATEGLRLQFLWGDPSLAVAEFRRGPSLPDPARTRLAAAPALHGDAGRAAELLLEASQAAGVEALEPRIPPRGQPPAVSEDLRARARAALDARPVLDRAAVEAAVEEVAMGSDRRSAWGLVVSELFRRAIAERDERPFFGNEIVTWVSEVEDFVPDPAGLLDAAGPESGADAQLGWTAARGGLAYLLSALAPELADPLRRLAAARLVAVAAQYADAGPPIVGGASPPPGPPAPSELIEDLVAANGGGRTRGLEATPEEALPEEAPAEGPSGAESRWILVGVTDRDRPELPVENAFRAAGTYEITVAIGPKQEGMLAAVGAESFDEALGPVADREQLFVTFIPPPSVSPPQTGTIFLPAAGTSRPCTFGVKLPPELTTFEAQIQVYHRNRMVQLALLRGPVVADPAQAGRDARIELELAVIRPSGGAPRPAKEFDLALARTSAATTAVTGEKLALFDNDRIDRVIPTLVDILTKITTSEAARQADLEDAGVVGLLRALAFHGRELHDAIAVDLDAQLGDGLRERLQVLVETGSDFFPIEFVYDLPAPTNDAGLCPGWKEGLEKGVCPESHEPTGPLNLAEHVCPTGFWALSKVIERQVVGKESWTKLGAAEADFAVRPHPTADRASLEPPQVVLFAASDKVDQVEPGSIAAVRKTLEGIATEALYAETWVAWVEAVRRGPSLLVLLSHSAQEQFQTALEVGAGDLRLISQVQSSYVSSTAERSPVVLLLGCETAVDDFALQTFVAKFQDLGAALVVGTVASVLGQRAAPVARTIASSFAAASKRKRPIPAGDLMLEIRRKLLAKGELTALCLTSFGDADWQLGGA